MVDSNISRSKSLIDSWKNRKDYKGYDRSKGSSYNSWRAIIYTIKGKDIGFPITWKTYDVFMEEVQGAWGNGYVAARIDKLKPHSKSNTMWVEKGQEALHRLVVLKYNNATKTLIEWAEELQLNYNGVRQRYFKGNGYSAEEILFGKKRKVHNKHDRDFAHRTSRMLGAYRLSDKKKSLHCDIDIETMRKIISNECVYCGDVERVGLDRVENSIGHTVSNVVPCCYVCNCARNDNFTYEEFKVIGKAIKEVREGRK